MNKSVMPKSGDRYISRYFLRFFKKYHSHLWTQMNALDLGSGRFRHTRFLQHVGISNITCVDKIIFPNRPKGITFLEHDLENGIPITEASSFDLIVCTYVFMFIQAREKLLDEIHRVANDGAFLVIQINLRPLAYGFPIELEPLVDHLLQTGEWRVLDRLSEHPKKGVVLRKRRKGGCRETQAD